MSALDLPLREAAGPTAAALIARLPDHPLEYQVHGAGVVAFNDVLPWAGELARAVEAHGRWGRSTEGGRDGEAYQVTDRRTCEEAMVMGAHSPRLAPYEEALGVLVERLLDAYRQYDQHVVTGSGPEWRDEGFHVLRYRPGQLYGEHVDATVEHHRWRELSVSVGLDEDYEGGELRFRLHGVHRRLPAGSALVWRAQGVPHEAKPPTSGTRRALVTWLYPRAARR